MKPRTALVVDDSPSSRDILATVLRHNGYTVKEATSVAEAQASIAAEPPAIVLLDVFLPRVDGFELLRHLRADPSTRSLPVVCVTAGATPEIRARAEALGCDRVVFKPEGPGRIMALVREVLGADD